MGFDLWVQRYLVVVLWLYEGIFFLPYLVAHTPVPEGQEPKPSSCVCVCVRACVHACVRVCFVGNSTSR